jgi:uncharacterized phage protein (TIGR02218 family)
LPPGLQDHLASGATTLAWCWKLVPRNGEPLGFTDHDRDLAFDGVTYKAEAGFTGSAIETSLGMAVDNLEVTSALQSDALSEARLRAGDYDNAAIEIWLVNWTDVSQRLLLRSGSLGEVSHGELGFSAEVRGHAHYLNQPKGRLFQFGCDAELGDARCGIDRDDPLYRGEGIVVSVSENRWLTVTGLESFAERWFARGRLQWTSGANIDRAIEVKAHRGSLIELWQAMSEAVAPGDEFTVTAGCDKQFSTCRAKFANGVNYRGFPHMPGNDFVTSYPNRGDAGNDGGSRN